MLHNHIAVSNVNIILNFGVPKKLVRLIMTCLHDTQNKVSPLRTAGHTARMQEGRSAFKILTDTSTGNKSLGRPKRRW